MSVFFLSDIINEVAREFDVGPDELRSRSRHRRCAWPRQEIYRRLRLRGWTLTQIGRALGRNHATILHGINQAERRLCA